MQEATFDLADHDGLVEKGHHAGLNALLNALYTPRL